MNHINSPEQEKLLSDILQKNKDTMQKIKSYGYTFHKITSKWYPTIDDDIVLIYSDQGKFKLDLNTGKVNVLLAVIPE